MGWRAGIFSSFFIGGAKLLNTRDLGDGDVYISSQNLEFKELTRKILQNKDLAGAEETSAFC
jgi:hypothetical protein